MRFNVKMTIFNINIKTDKLITLQIMLKVIEITLSSFVVTGLFSGS